MFTLNYRSGAWLLAAMLMVVLVATGCNVPPPPPGAPTPVSSPAAQSQTSVPSPTAEPSTPEQPSATPTTTPALAQAGETPPLPPTLEPGAVRTAAENEAEGRVFPGRSVIGPDGIRRGFTPDGTPYMGEPTAPIVVFEFSDFQCPYCQQYVQKIEPTLKEKYIATGKMVMIYKNYPLNDIHANALQAAYAAQCAGEQNAFWAMHDRLFESQAGWQDLSGDALRTELLSYATDLGLDASALDTCMNSDAVAEKVRTDIQQGQQAGIRATPTFVINGRIMPGSPPLADWEKITNFLLAKARGEITPTPVPRLALSDADLSPDPDHPGFTLNGDPYLGDPVAPVVVVEFSDFQCPYCERAFNQLLPKLKQQFIDTGQIRFVFMAFPLRSIHPNAQKAAEAAACAGAQSADAFWQMHDRLYETQSSWAQLDAGAAQQFFIKLASDLGLDASFDTCLTEGQQAEKVNSTYDLALRSGANGTPAFYVDGEQQPSWDLNALARAIQAAEQSK